MATTEELQEFARSWPLAGRHDEGGACFIFVPALALPSNWTPATCDVLFCPDPRDGYDARLFFATKPSGPKELNWNGTARIMERNWFAFSWRLPPGLGFVQRFIALFEALR